MPLPTFLILGAAKCGTTSLHTMFSQHPDVFMGSTKDPLFFELDAEYSEGPEAYRRYFRGWSGQRAIGDSRPTKLLLPWVPERVRQCLPDAKLIAILRDPADRAFSHWWMRRCNGLESLDFEEALRWNAATIETGRSFEGPAGPGLWKEHLDAETAMAPVYLEYGYYASQLDRWLRVFDWRQIKVVLFDDLKSDPEALLLDLFEFVGVDPTRFQPGRAVYNAALPQAALSAFELDRRTGLSRFIPRSLRQGAKDVLSRLGSPPRLEPATRRWLVAHYDREIRSLEALIARDLTNWRVAASPAA